MGTSVCSPGTNFRSERTLLIPFWFRSPNTSEIQREEFTPARPCSCANAKDYIIMIEIGRYIQIFEDGEASVKVDYPNVAPLFRDFSHVPKIVWKLYAGTNGNDKMDADPAVPLSNCTRAESRESNDHGVKWFQRV